MIRQNWLECRIPPPIIMVIMAYTIYSTNDLKTWQFTGSASNWIGIVFGLIGSLILMAGIIPFHLQKTTVNPLAPDRASQLVTTGIYKVTRNPMYLGMAILLTAWCIYLSSTTGWIFLLAFIVFITKFQIQPEERILVKKFGIDFENYRLSVRRWF